jgi:hypothetical protein
LREEHRLRVFENRALRIIFGPERDDEIGEVEKTLNEDTYDLYSSPNVIWEFGIVNTYVIHIRLNN